MRTLCALLSQLPLPALTVVRAFSFFSPLPRSAPPAVPDRARRCSPARGSASIPTPRGAQSLKQNLFKHGPEIRRGVAESSTGTGFTTNSHLDEHRCLRQYLMSNCGCGVAWRWLRRGRWWQTNSHHPKVTEHLFAACSACKSLPVTPASSEFVQDWPTASRTFTHVVEHITR